VSGISIQSITNYRRKIRRVRNLLSALSIIVYINSVDFFEVRKIAEFDFVHADAMQILWVEQVRDESQHQSKNKIIWPSTDYCHVRRQWYTSGRFFGSLS